MEVLSDQAAIEYLTRARSCLRPEVDTFGSIPLLYAMISLEEAFLARLAAKGHKGLPLPLDSHGLPELSAWRIDIIKAFEEASVIRENRAQALDPFLQEVVDASLSGVDKKFEELQVALESDHVLLDALGKFSSDRVDFLIQPWISSKTTFSLFTDRRFPGLLLSKSDRSPFSERLGTRRRFNGLDFRLGLKYVDAEDPNGTRTPFFVAVVFTPAMEVLGFKLITPRFPLLWRSQLIEKEVRVADEGFTNLEYYDLALPKTTEKKSDEDTSLDETTIVRIEEGFRKLHPSILRAFYQTDYTGKPTAVVDHYFASLLALNGLVDKIIEFSEEVLDSRPISLEESTGIKKEVAESLQTIYNSVADNSLKRTLQLAMAEEMKNTRIKTEDAKIRQEKGIWGILGRR